MIPLQLTPGQAARFESGIEANWRGTHLVISGGLGLARSDEGAGISKSRAKSAQVVFSRFRAPRGVQDAGLNFGFLRDYVYLNSIR
jgi:hypothetical protein